MSYNIDADDSQVVCRTVCLKCLYVSIRAYKLHNEKDSIIKRIGTHIECRALSSAVIITSRIFLISII